jgi:hypothetical protein
MCGKRSWLRMTPSIASTLFPSNDFAALPLEVAGGEQEPEMEPLY